LTFICYIEVYFAFVFQDCVCYNEDFVKSRFIISRFCSKHFIVILGGLKKIVCYTEDFVIQRLVKSRFHCNYLLFCISKFSRILKFHIYIRRKRIIRLHSTPPAQILEPFSVLWKENRTSLIQKVIFEPSFGYWSFLYPSLKED